MKRLLLLALLVLILGAPGMPDVAPTATLDELSRITPLTPAVADDISYQLNSEYLRELTAADTHGIETWAALEVQRTRDNLQRAQQAGAHAAFGSSAWQRDAREFVRLYAAEQKRLARV